MLGALVVSIAVLPALAAADEGLTVFLFVSPRNLGVGQTVEVNLEAYHWGTPVDLETLDVMTGFYGGTAITMTNVSMGKWHGTYLIDATWSAAGGFIVTANAALGALSATAFDYYTLASAGSVSTDWQVKMRVANYDQVGFSPGPGSTVVLEGRSYLNGTLADGGPLNASIASVEGGAFSLSSGTPTYENMTGTKVSAGIYRFNVVIPSALLVTRAYVASVMLGTGTGASTDETGFFVHPFPVVGGVSASSATGATVKVWVGTSTPITGAEVKLGGQLVSFTTFQTTNITAVSGTTDARGSANVSVTWAGAGYANLFANVTSGGKTAVLALFVAPVGGATGWIPTPNLPFGCSAATQTNPFDFTPGHTATLKIRVTESGTVVASTSIARFIYRQGGTSVEQAGNVTTDAQGNFTVTYAIPSTWTSGSTLNVQVICPTGTTDTEYINFGGAGSPFGGKLTASVTNNKVGGKMHVTATYSGTSTLENAAGIAFIVPGNSSSFTLTGIGGSGPFGVLTKSGATFSGDIQVPGHYPDGPYVLYVFVTNDAATNTLSSQASEGNISLITMGAASGPSGAGGGLFGMPGFDAAAALGAAGIAGLAAVEIRRRRVN